jgi:hypothetical protein
VQVPRKLSNMAENEKLPEVDTGFGTIFNYTPYMAI